MRFGKWRSFFHNFTPSPYVQHTFNDLINATFCSTFKLPPRSAIWRPIQNFGYPDWSMAAIDPPPLKHPEMPTRPGVPSSLNEITMPFMLKDVSSFPFKPNKKRAWTEEERNKAAMANVAQNIEQFSELVFTISTLPFKLHSLISLWCTAWREI